MTKSAPPETLSAPTRPARPDLFASPASGQQASSPRISVLASLDSRPAPAPRRSRRPIWLALAGIFGACALGVGFWVLTTQPTPNANLAERPPAPQPIATASISAPIESARVHQETAAAASIETIPLDPAPEKESTATISEPAATVSSPTPPSPSAHPSDQTETAGAGSPTKPHKSLLSALAAKPTPSEKTTTKTATKSTKTASTEREAMDTDVILLEALVAHNKKKSAAPAPSPITTPSEGDAKP